MIQHIRLETTQNWTVISPNTWGNSSIWFVLFNSLINARNIRTLQWRSPHWGSPKCVRGPKKHFFSKRNWITNWLCTTTTRFHSVSPQSWFNTAGDLGFGDHWEYPRKVERYFRHFQNKSGQLRKIINCEADTTWKTVWESDMTRTDKAGSQQWTAVSSLLGLVRTV